MGYTDRYKKVIRVCMQVRRVRESVGDAMYYADDMMMGCRGERKKGDQYSLRDKSRQQQNSKKSRNGKWGLVSSLTFQGIFTFFGASNGEGEGGLVEMRIFELSRCNWNKPQRVAGYRVLDVAVLNLEIYNIGSWRVAIDALHGLESSKIEHWILTRCVAGYVLDVVARSRIFKNKTLGILMRCSTCYASAQLSSDRDVLRIVHLSWHPTRDLQSKDTIHHGRINVLTLKTQVAARAKIPRGRKEPEKNQRIKNSR